MKVSELNNMSMNEGAKYYYYERKWNVLPAKPNNIKAPNLETWDQYKNNRIPVEMFEHWILHDLFKHGILCVLGKIYDDDGSYIGALDFLLYRHFFSQVYTFL